MKHMFKKSIFLIALASVGFVFGAEPNFELWNKHNDPIYFAVGKSADDINRQQFKELRAGKWVQDSVDTSKPTILAFRFGKAPTSGDRLDTYTIKANKKLIMRIGLPAEKEKFKETLKSVFGKTSIAADGYIFGPQSGPLLGFKAASGVLPIDWSDTINERGLHLKGNFTKDDITKGSMIYLPK